MGYEVDLLFKQCNSLEDAFSTITDFTTLIKTEPCVREYLSKIVCFSPPVDGKSIKELSEPNLQLNRTENFLWLEESFSWSFIWWKDYNLLGLKFNPQYLPDKAKELFDLYCFFHNNESHGYDNISDYGNKIKIINDIIAQAKSLDKDELIDRAIASEFVNITEKELDEFDAKQLSYEWNLPILINNEIEKALKIIPLADGKEASNVYRKIVINAIDSRNTRNKIYPIMVEETNRYAKSFVEELMGTR